MADFQRDPHKWQLDNAHDWRCATCGMTIDESVRVETWPRQKREAFFQSRCQVAAARRRIDESITPPEVVTSRKVYRSSADGLTYKLVATIDDNITPTVDVKI